MPSVPERVSSRQCSQKYCNYLAVEGEKFLPKVSGGMFESDCRTESGTEPF